MTAIAIDHVVMVVDDLDEAQRLEYWTERTLALFFGFIIAYYAATSMVAAFSAQGFHRYPANVFLFLLSSYAVSHLLSVWFNRRKRADATRAEHISFQP